MKLLSKIESEWWFKRAQIYNNFRGLPIVRSKRPWDFFTYALYNARSIIMYLNIVYISS